MTSAHNIRRGADLRETSPHDPDGLADAPARRVARVVIVDNDRVLCELLRDRLPDEDGLACAGIATTGEEARRLIESERPEIVLVDLMDIVDVSDGRGVDAIDLAAELAVLSPASQLLIWTAWTDPTPGREEELRRRVRAARAGATDWVRKADGSDNVILRIRAAVRRGSRAPGGAAPSNPIMESLEEFLHVGPGRRVALACGGEETLTPAQRRWVGIVAPALEAGMRIEEIARLHSISVGGLRTHLKNVYEVWDVHNQPAFVAEARRRGYC
jgi:DNA-binding NarL/FixJ family response regulator